MADLLTRLKLKRSFEIELDSSKEQVMDGFVRCVDYSKHSTVMDLSDLFSKSKNLYKGYLAFDKFQMRRKWSPFRFYYVATTAKGQLISRSGKTIVTGEINGFHTRFKVYFGFLLFFYGIMLTLLIAFPIEDSNSLWSALPFILIHGGLMIGVPFYMVRKSVSVMSSDLEREFFYMTREVKP